MMGSVHVQTQGGASLSAIHMTDVTRRGACGVCCGGWVHQAGDVFFYSKKTSTLAAAWCVTYGVFNLERC